MFEQHSSAMKRYSNRPKVCDNGSFGDVASGYGYLMVAFDQVNPAEEVQQCRPLDRSCMFRRGYLSGVVMVLRLM
jgi:hypothetical protein